MDPVTATYATEGLLDAPVLEKQGDAHILAAVEVPKSSALSTDDKLTGSPVASDEDEDDEVDESKLLHGAKLALAFTAMLLSVLLVALDQTIIAPALPVIASDFQALEQLGWIAAAYFLTQAAFMLVYGQALTVWNRRWVYLIAIGFFELGSLLCGIATNVNVVILGRAIAGLGGAGIFVTVLSIIADITLLEARPKLFAAFGAVFGVSSVVGPLLGGAFTDKVSWKWCFLINLPIGAITVAAIVFILPSSPAPPLKQDVRDAIAARWTFWTRGRYQPREGTFVYTLAAIDYFGTIVMLGIVTCLVLALQWGGNKYAWSEGIIIGLLVGAFALIGILILYQWKISGLLGLLPLRYFRNRTQVGANIQSFCMMWAMLFLIYNLPVYFQVVKNQNATQSGISLLPFMLGIVLTSGVAGFAASKTGRYWWLLAVCPYFMSIGGGLLYSLKVDSNNGKLYGYQIVFALGIGPVLQTIIIAVQASVPKRDVPQATALVQLFQLLGGVVGLAVTQSVFSNKLIDGLAQYAPTAPLIVRQSTEAVWDDAVTAPAIRLGVQVAYVEALTSTFIIGVPLGISCALAAFLIQNIDIRGKKMAMGPA